MWIQYDGAPPHFGREVVEYWNADFQGRWRGLGGPVV